MGDRGKTGSGVRRTFHSFNAYPSKRHCKKAARTVSSEAKLGSQETLELKGVGGGVNI